MTTIPRWAEAADAVRAGERILLVTHMSPDGDAIGSLLGAGNMLRELGKPVDCAVDEGVPDFFKFLPGAQTVHPILTSGAWDVMISLDASDEARTGVCGEYGRANSQRVINLDHHATNTYFGDIHLVLPTAVSATEVVYHWLRAVDFPLTREVAVPLLTGLVTDTLGFRTSNVRPETLAIAQALMQAGASLTEITARTLDNRSILQVNLWKYALASVAMVDGAVVAAQITQDDLKRSGLLDVTDGGLVGFLAKINEAMIAVVFKETPEGRVEISLRAKPGFDVSEVALSLGGGGHKQAAGATIDGPLDAARARVIPLLQAASRKGKLEIV